MSSGPGERERGSGASQEGLHSQVVMMMVKMMMVVMMMVVVVRMMWIIITHPEQNVDDFEDLLWGHRQKMGRLGTAEEIANLVLYLSSDEVITLDYQKHNKTLLEPLPESSTQANVITPQDEKMKQT